MTVIDGRIHRNGLSTNGDRKNTSYYSRLNYTRCTVNERIEVCARQKSKIEFFSRKYSAFDRSRENRGSKVRVRLKDGYDFTGKWATFSVRWFQAKWINCFFAKLSWTQTAFLRKKNVAGKIIIKPAGNWCLLTRIPVRLPFLPRTHSYHDHIM